MSEAMLLTNVALKPILADTMLYRGVVTDLDEVCATGVYNTISTSICQNPPTDFMDIHWQYSIVEVFVRQGMDVLQRLSAPKLNVVVQRIGKITVPHSWSGWVKLTP